MSFTLMDIVVILITLFSGFLSLLRGFSREFFSLASMAGAAFMAYFGYERLVPFFAGYFKHPIIAIALAAALVFIVSLFVFSFITMRIADFLVKSAFGPIDRLLGLAFGCIRGILLCTFAVVLITTMSRVENRPLWFENAKTLPMLEFIANKILAMLPSDLASYMDYAEELVHKKSEP